jgi:hypothetical protein
VVVVDASVGVRWPKETTNKSSQLVGLVFRETLENVNIK